MTLEERMAVLEEQMSRLLEFLAEDAEDGSDEPEGPDEYDSPLLQIRMMTDLPFGFILPDEIDIDWTPGVEAAQACATAFLREPDRENREELTLGEYWWCIMRGYAALEDDPANADPVGADPDGLRPALLERNWLSLLRQLAYFHAWYHDGIRQPKVPVPTGEIDRENLPFSVGGH